MGIECCLPHPETPPAKIQKGESTMAKPKKLTVKIIRELREDYARDMNKIGTIKMARQLTNYDLKTALALVNWVLERPGHSDEMLVTLWCSEHRAPSAECAVQAKGRPR
jgi:hypothetical protein